MSLNKFTDIQQEKKWMNINCKNILTEELECKTTDGYIVNFKTPNKGGANYVLTTDGSGNCSFVNLTGTPGDPLLYSRTQNIDDIKTVAGNTQINGTTKLFTLNVDSDFSLKMGDGNYVSFLTPNRGQFGYVLSTDGSGNCYWINNNLNDITQLINQCQNIDIVGTTQLITKINGLIKCSNISSMTEACNINLATNIITNTATTINLDASTVQQNSKKVITEEGNKNLDLTLTTSQTTFTRAQELVTKKYVDEHSGSGGITNPFLYTVYPASNDVDLGTLTNPFRKLYVQNSTIDMINTSDDLKSGSISIIEGSVYINSKTTDANVNLGHSAGAMTALNQNCTSIGNYANENSSANNLIALGFSAGRDDNKNNCISIGNGSHISHGGEFSIGIGTLAGASIFGSSGDHSICIGTSAGQDNSGNNSIIINATGGQLDSYNEGLFIKPIRELNDIIPTKILQYDDSTGEISSSNIVQTGVNPFNYNFSTNTIIPVSTGILEFNDPINNNVTEIYLSNTSSISINVKSFLSSLSPSSIIIIQASNDSNDYITFSLNSDPTVYATYSILYVNVISSNGTGSTNFGNDRKLLLSILSNDIQINNNLIHLNNKTQNIEELKTNSTRTYFNNVVESDTGFKITGGTNIQYLMADGSITTSSGGGQNSNIYLYNNSNIITPPPNNGQILYNDAIQQNATLLYISHRTRDTIDIDPFLQQITTLNLIYIQDETNSNNYIKFDVSGSITIVPNDYIIVPIVYNIGGGTGLTSFGNGHNIFMSIFLSSPEIDTRLSALETKTQNQSAISNETTFIGNVKATNFIIPTGLSTELLYADGSYNSNIYNKLYSDKIGIGQGSGGITQADFTTAVGTNCGTNNQGRGSTSLGFLSGTNDQKERATAIGMQSGYNNQGEGAISIGFLCAYENQGNYAISIGTNIGTNQVANSVVISGGESGLGNLTYQTEEGFFINPVRIVNSQTTNVLTYNPVTKEMTYNSLFDLTDITNATSNNTANTIVKRDASGNFSAGEITATSININGNSKQILLANGTVNSTLLDVTNWRYQSFGYYGTVPTTSNIDSASGWMVNQGGSITLQTIVSNTVRNTKYRVQSNVSSTTNGGISGWMGSSASPPIFIKQGFKVIIGFGLGDSTSNALTRSMIGLFQANTAPVLNNTTTVASVTTQSIGIIQESSENVWSFNTRGSSASTKVASVISCTTPSSTWFILEILNQVNSNDVTMILTDQETGLFSTQTFTCNTPTTINTTLQCYIQCQRNMSSPGGVSSSSILQTSCFRIWSAV